MTFRYSDYCNKKLFELFPTLCEYEKYKDVFKYAYMDPEHGANGIYEDAFCDYILELIKNNKSEDRSKIKKAFDLIEELIQHEVFEVQCVAKVSFIEPFVDKIKPTKEVEKYLGPHSLRAAQDIAFQRFGFNPNTWERD